MPAWCGCRSPANLRMFESLASIYFSPVLLNSEEIDPVNAWATLGTIGQSVRQTARARHHHPQQRPCRGLAD